MFKRCAGLLLVALFPLASLAQEAPAAAPPGALVDPTIHRHKGFFIRPELGFGYFGTSASQGGITQKLSGGGGVFALAIGGAVSEDFILAGQVWDYVASDPTLSISGGGFDGSGTVNGSAALVGYGVLLNWYFMPGNLYVAVTPSLTKVASIDENGDTDTTDWGFGARVGLGKEWWVSDHWGLGLAGSIALSSNKYSVGGGSLTYGTFCAGLTFSATYN